jgi:hypothetical protein
VARVKMTFVCPLVFQHRCTRRAFDLLEVVLVNVAFFETTTPGCNAIFAKRISDQVADIHFRMPWICISANNDSPVVFPSLAHAVKILHLRRRASIFPDPGTLPQDMRTPVNGHDVGRERQLPEIASRKLLVNIGP